MDSATVIRTSQLSRPSRVRLAGAMTFSLLVHALLLSLQFGIPGIGLPALELPWRERRAQTADLDVVLAGVVKTPPTADAKPAEAPAADVAHTTPPPTPAASLKLYASPDALRPAPPTPAAAKKTRARKSPPQPIARRQPARAKKETPVIALDQASKGAFVVPAPATDEALPETAAEYETPTPAVASAEPAVTDNPPEPAGEDPMAIEREQAALKRAEEVQARLARETEARRQQEAAAQRQALEQETRRKEEDTVRRQTEALALEQSSRQQEETRQQEQQLALAREERRKEEENARQQAALALQKQTEEQKKREQEAQEKRALELAAQQREVARRLEAEKAEREAAELQARKQLEEAARQQAAARESERKREAEELAAKERERAQELAARQKAEAAAGAGRRDPELVLGDAPPSGNARGGERLADLSALPRGITGGGLAGRALDQVRRPDLLRNDAPNTRQDGLDNPRRRTSIFGNADKDVGLMMYVDSWRLKIERNGALNYKQSSVDKAHRDPVVTVAIRSDGSVEDIVIHQSSGRPELDEAVRRIVRINARYSAFPPELARRYDVIEIRRAWNFDDRVRILEEVR